VDDYKGPPLLGAGFFLNSRQLLNWGAGPAVVVGDGPHAGSSVDRIRLIGRTQEESAKCPDCTGAVEVGAKVGFNLPVVGCVMDEARGKSLRGGTVVVSVLHRFGIQSQLDAEIVRVDSEGKGRSSRQRVAFGSSLG